MNERPEARPCNLHVTHSWGGGIERWVMDFCSHDQVSDNLVLENIGTPDCYGIGARLVDGSSGRELGSWIFRHPISETRVTHPEYRELVQRVCAEKRISHIYLSCLIGHSLDLFDLGIPVTKIHHDYYPCCPNIYKYWDEPCPWCNQDRVGECLTRNPVSFANRKSSAGYWKELREAYVAALLRPHVLHVFPTPSVFDHLVDLDPRLASVSHALIPHGIDLAKQDSFGGAEYGRHLRVAVLGTQHIVKGLKILEEAFKLSRLVVDFTFLGAGPEGRTFASSFGVRYLERYEHCSLGELLSEGRFDLALFASAFAETFCYTLSEVWAHAIPPCARKVGSFVDRIHHGEDGFLIDSRADDIVDFVLFANSNRHVLQEVAGRIRELPVRTVAEMVEDYYRVRSRPVEAMDARPSAGADRIARAEQRPGSSTT